MNNFDDIAVKICGDQITLGEINSGSSQVCFPPVGAVQDRRAGGQGFISA